MSTIRRVCLAAALLGVAAGCSVLSEREDAEIAVARALVSDEQEAQLGEQFHQELAREGVRYEKDPLVTAYVDGLLARLTPFATPGGHLYTPPDRIERVNQAIARDHLSGAKIGAESLQPIKQRLESKTPVSWK